MNPKKLKIVDSCTKLLGTIDTELSKMKEANHVLDNLALLRSEIQSSRFAENNYFNLDAKVSNINMCRRNLEEDVAELTKQIERLKLIESALAKVART